VVNGEMSLRRLKLSVYEVVTPRGEVYQVLLCLAVLLCSHAEYVSHLSFGLTPVLKKNILDLFKLGSTVQASLCL
jgi:hypothetical protein